jgi:hypothetical protein
MAPAAPADQAGQMDHEEVVLRHSGGGLAEGLHAAQGNPQEMEEQAGVPV